MDMVARLFSRTQPDPVSPAPTMPQLRVLPFSTPPPVRDLVTVCDGIEGVRILVQRHGADSVQRWLSNVITLEGLHR